MLSKKKKNRSFTRFLVPEIEGEDFMDIMDIIDRFNDNMLWDVYYRSEKPPESQNSKLLKIVSKNYQELVQKNQRDFFLAILGENPES